MLTSADTGGNVSDNAICLPMVSARPLIKAKSLRASADAKGVHARKMVVLVMQCMIRCLSRSLMLRARCVRM